MPTATSTIITQAFRLMERTPPSSMDDDSDEARAANEQYPLALGGTLEVYDWSFARKTVQLSEAAAPVDEFVEPELPHWFLLPADCVKLRFVKTLENWRLDEGMIKANVADTLVVRYTRLITDEAKLPSMVQSLVSHNLALKLMPAYVSTRTKRADLKADTQDILAQAIRDDRYSAQQYRSDEREDDQDWACEAVR